jgi:hypothetical protein
MAFQQEWVNNTYAQAVLRSWKSLNTEISQRGGRHFGATNRTCSPTGLFTENIATPTLLLHDVILQRLIHLPTLHKSRGSGKIT